MNRFRITTAAVLVAALGLGSAALAQGPRGGGPGGPGRGGPGGRGALGGLPVGQLNLTQAQQDLIRDIRERNSTELKQVETRVREAHAAQQKAIEAIPVNEAAIRAATLALGEVQADVAVLQARVRGEIFASLTADQQAQVKKLLAERDQRAQQRQQQVQQRRQNRQ